jgi:hypothetical protein
MDDYSQLYCTEPPLKNMGVSEHHVFEPPKLSRPTVSDPFESPASAFHAAGTYMDLLQQHDEHQVVNIPPLCSQFPTHDSNILLCQSSHCNFSIDSAHDQAGSNFRDTLQSLVKSHLCSNQCISSSEKPNKIPCNNVSNPFPHAQNILLLGENDALVRKQLSVPSDANQGLNVISYLPFFFFFSFFFLLLLLFYRNCGIRGLALTKFLNHRVKCPLYTGWLKLELSPTYRCTTSKNCLHS